MPNYSFDIPSCICPSIPFCSCEAAERITARDHSVRGVPLKVTRVLPPDPAACKVFVSNLPDGCSAESLELYFDSVKRSGGGGVQDVAMSSDCLEAVVTFENPDG